MNIDWVHGTQQSYPADKTNSRKTTNEADAPGDLGAIQTSRWDTKDTVEISEQAYEALEFGKVRESDKFSKEDLAPLKERFAELKSMKSGINSKLKELMEKNGISLGIGDQLKVELDKNGNALVGGIEDAHASKALAKAINEDPELLKEIAAYQKEEKAVSRDLRSVTGMSLNDYAKRIDELQRMPKEQIIEMPYTQDQRIGLLDQELGAVDPEFAEMISKEYAVPSSTADISGEKNILENADSTVKGAVRDVIAQKATPLLEDINKGLRIQLSKGEITQEEYDNSVVSFNNIILNVDSDVMTTYDGTFCKDNKKLDEHVKETIAEFFKEDLLPNPATGEKHDFQTASQHLVNQYENAYDEYGADPKVEVTYKAGMLESHLSDPVKEQEIKEEIVVEARTALEDLGVQNADKLEVDVTEEGALVVTNPPENAHDAEILEKALESLNAQTKDRGVEDHLANKQPNNDPVARLKGHLAHLDLYLPNGTKDLGKLDINA